MKDLRKADGLPNDSDGDALRRLIATGSDLSRPMEIDFNVAVPSEEAAKAVSSRAVPLNFRPSIFHNVETDSWTCNCTKTLVPSYDEIISIQKQLDDVSRPFGGKSDGWGSWGNAEKSNCADSANSLKKDEGCS
jgi:hypothetical protein